MNILLVKRLISNKGRMMSSIFVKPVLALQDNLMYIVGSSKDKVCGVVDPVDPEKILSEVNKLGSDWTLSCVLTTHHHWDHAGGNEKLHAMKPSVPIYGGDDRIDALSNKISDNSSFKLGNLNVKCLATPCHTSGHICYLVSSDNEKVVFTGDTLFIAGCGRFFEGTAKEMHAALIEKLGALDKDTKVFCGHEYTVSNLKYAIHVEPNNENIHKKMEWASNVRKEGKFTVPSTIGDELLTNPFMRVNQEDVQSHAGSKNVIEVMQKLRDGKNNFKA